MADELKKKRTVAKARLTRNIRKLKEAIEDNFAEVDVRKCLQDMNTSADELEDLHSSYIEALNTDDADEIAWVDEETKRTREARKTASAYLKGVTTSSPSKVKLKAMDYPMFDGKSRNFIEWRNSYNNVIKPRLVGASDAELALCLKNCLPSDVIDKLAPDCKTETDILAELTRQYGVKDRVSNIAELCYKLKLFPLLLKGLLGITPIWVFRFVWSSVSRWS